MLLGLALFGAVELLFFGSNLFRLMHGGWKPLALGGIIFLPRVDTAQRMRIAELVPGICLMAVRFGLREEPDLTRALEGAVDHGLGIDQMTTTYFVARATVIDGPGERLPLLC